MSATRPAALTWLDLDDNAFTRVPPALEAATALVSLQLRCKTLRVGTSDTEALLAGKPNLRRLRCYLLPGVYEHLQEAAPLLEVHGSYW